jgi:serine/threonine-protein kinase
VHIRNVELAPPFPFIATDYLQNGSVGARLENGVSMVDAVRWTREALDGLAYAHDAGIIHRDIKPDNVLLDDHERAVLSDFGIAEDTIRGLIANPAVYVRHAAPEVALRGTSKASDIYAMGCTLYRLLTGEFPFPDGVDAASGSLVDPHRLNPQVPMALTRVVRTALAANPGDRYEDARRMLAALMSCAVRFCWSSEDDPATQETWHAEGSDGEYLLKVTERRGKHTVLVTRDKGAGAGHRRVLVATTPRRAEAERIRRNVLLELVADGRCS